MKIYSKKHFVRGIILIALGIIAIITVIVKSLNNSTDKFLELCILALLCFLLGGFLVYQSLVEKSALSSSQKETRETITPQDDDKTV